MDVVFLFYYYNEINILSKHMRVSEVIERLETIKKVYGDENIVFESNRHRFEEAHVVEHNGEVVLSMFGKSEIK